MKRENSIGAWFKILIEIFPIRFELCVRWTSIVHPGILTLPGTVGRGFYVIFRWKVLWHMDICVIRKYPQTVI